MKLVYPLINISRKKISKDIQFLFDKNRELNNSAFIPFQPDLFSTHLLYTLLAVCVALPLLLEINFHLKVENVWLWAFQAVIFFIAFVMFRVHAHRRMNELYNSGQARNGLFITKDFLVIRKGRRCQVFPKSSIVRVRSSWVAADESDEKGISITYLPADEKNKKYEFSEGYYGNINPEKVSKYLNDWLDRGLKKKGLIEE